MIRSFAAFAMLAVLFLVAPASAAGVPQTWLVMSDIHFDPFTQERLVDRLAATPSSRWRDVFASVEKLGPSNPGSDTNFTLLESALDGARNAAPEPRVVILAGDFLAHEFRAKFDRAARVHTDEAYRDFVDKTIAFLAWEIQTAFPRAQLLPVIGNNDGYCGDYASTPRDAFLAHMGADWAASAGAASGSAFVAQFSTGGYYSVPLPAGHALAIVLNDVFWSAKYQNICGDPHDNPGATEVTWLQQTQHALLASTPVWIIAHEPPGIDVASSLHVTSSSVLPVPLAIPFLAPNFNAAMVGALDTGNTVMAIAGHTHMNSLRVVGPDPSRPRVPMLVVPSISPVFGNAPAFTLLSVDPDTAIVNDSQVFVLSEVHGAWVWHREYDFDSIYGPGSLDAAHLWNAQLAIFDDERVRRRFEEYYESGDTTAPVTETTWRAYWCANIALTPMQYSACATPQVSPDNETHPTAPPTPTPSPMPSPAPSPQPSPKSTP
jgi:sphingomyelin phosphodiesterase acid-like 3